MNIVDVRNSLKGYPGFDRAEVFVKDAEGELHGVSDITFNGTEPPKYVIFTSEKLPIPDNVKVAAYHLLWVWHQYGGGQLSEDGKVLVLPHMCMQAGECATDFLVRLGLAYDDGHAAVLTTAGMELLNSDID